MRRLLRKGVAAFFIIIVTTGVFVFFLLNFPTRSHSTTQQYGITFTPGQAISFGLDWRETYRALLDDLSVRHVRLAAYWNGIQPQADEFSFTELDELMDELGKRGGTALLAVGRKLPRWPECHEPAWLSAIPADKREEALLHYVQVVVERYRHHTALEFWQIENEVTFPFGKCPKLFGLETLKKEVALVRKLDPLRKIVITDSGEWSSWTLLSRYGDIIGSSLYREAWNERLGYIPFPVRPGWYQLRADILRARGKEAIITELQAEPWGRKAAQEMTVAEGLAAMPVEKIKKNMEFAREVGFSEVYLWGAEWWYWLKEQGDDSVWNEVKNYYAQ